MNWAPFNLAHRKESHGPVQNGVFYRQIGAGTRSYTRQKSGLVIARLLYFRAWQGLGSPKPVSLHLEMWHSISGSIWGLLLCFDNRKIKLSKYKQTNLERKITQDKFYVKHLNFKKIS